MRLRLKQLEREDIEKSQNIDKLNDKLQKQEEYIRRYLKESKQQGSQEIQIYELQYERDVMREKIREAESKLKYLEGENERLKGMSHYNHQS